MGSHHAAQPQSPQPEFVADEVIVKFRDGADEFDKDMARFRVSGTRKKLFKYVPGLEVIKLRRGVSVEEAIKLYQQDPSVSYAEPNYILKTQLAPNDPRFVSGEMWGLNNTGQSGGAADADIDAVEAWNQTTGSGNIIVAVIDSGINYNHPDLAANMFRNEADCNNNGIDNDGNGYIDDCYGIDTHNDDSNPMDDNNHGTHVAGTIGARGNNDAGVTGVNWNIKIMACKFVNSSGSGTTESAIDCLEYVKTMKDRGFNIIATSNSWGGGEFSQALSDAIDVQRQRGILFITAAGNGNFFGAGINNDSAPFYPCTHYVSNVICVAATTRTDARSGFSNYGRRTVHIGAPGSDILSTTRNGGYGFSSGTSMATPHVSGVAALLKAQDPNRDWRAIKNLILAGGDDISSMASTITGKRLNANGAMTCSNKVVQTRLQPISDTVNGAVVGEPINLAALNINCAASNGDLTVTVNPGGESVTLKDDGLLVDTNAGDGIYSGQWVPSVEGNFTLTFPHGDRVSVSTANVLISISPSAIDFAGVSVGTSAQRTIVVKNIGNQSFSGQATTEAPFSIISGGSYSLSPGQSQSVVIGFTPPSLGTFEGDVTFTGGIGASASVTGIGAKVDTITPNPVDLTSRPSSFAIQGSGFADLGFGLSVANFYRNGTLIAQARASSGTSTSLTVPFPTTKGLFTTLPGLSVGNVTVQIYNQSGSSGWSLVGSVGLSIIQSTPPTSVTSISPNAVDLATPPSSFMVTGSGFTNFGFGLPVANFYRNGTLIAQARASAGTSTSLTVPFPTTKGLFGTLPGLSVGTASVQIYNQTASSTWSLVGSVGLSIIQSTPPTSVTSISPNPVDLATPPSSFMVTGSGFTNFGFGLPVANFYRNGTLIAQARASSGTSTSLTVPFPTTKGLFTTLPGLSVGNVTVQIYNQSGSNIWNLAGSIPLVINDTRTLTHVVTSQQ